MYRHGVTVQPPSRANGVDAIADEVPALMVLKKERRPRRAKDSWGEVKPRVETRSEKEESRGGGEGDLVKVRTGDKGAAKRSVLKFEDGERGSICRAELWRMWPGLRKWLVVTLLGTKA